MALIVSPDALRSGVSLLCAFGNALCYPDRWHLGWDAAPEIGTAVLIKNEVVATLGDNKRDLREGVRVHRTEYLQTGDERPGGTEAR